MSFIEYQILHPFPSPLCVCLFLKKKKKKKIASLYHHYKLDHFTQWSISLSLYILLYGHII